jgi:hypothetical protein
MRNLRILCRPWLPIFAFVLAALATPTAVGAQFSQEVNKITEEMSELIARLSEDLAAGNKKVTTELGKIGLAKEADHVLRLDGKLLLNLSADAVITTMYHMAEARAHGELFLAKLHRRAASSSAALKTDPQYARFLKFSDSQLEKIDFAPVAEIAALRNRAPLPPEVHALIDILAVIYAAPHLGQVRAIAKRALNLPDPADRIYEQSLAVSATTEEAIAHLLTQHGPPPTVNEAAEAFVKQAIESSAALKSDPKLSLKIKEYLDQKSARDAAIPQTVRTKERIGPPIRPHR